MTTSYPTFETADNAAAHADEQEVFVLPLSFAQQRLWFLDQLEPGNPFYNMPSALRLSGSLRVGALRRALEEVVRRHEVLRTTFSVMEGEPVQVIREAASVSLPVIDLSSLPQVEREAEAEMLARDEAARPFDLERGPLVRASLLKLTEQEHLLLLTMHHIISDGWSMGVLVREVAALYEGYSRGGESPLAELAVQYGDYAVWQREHLRGEVLDSQLTYWKQQLAGAPAALELPTDRPRPAVQTYRGAQHDFALPKAVAEGLRELGRAEGATLYMTLLAGWQALLARYSNQEDISVGSPIAGRQRSEMEGLIGFFVNTLVMRARVSGEESFTSLLGRVREVCLGAYAHQDVPFEKLVEELQPERDPSRSPLFQVAFALQNTPPSRLALPGLQLSVVEPPVKTAKFDLTLVLTEGPQGLEGSAVYNTDLFDAATVRRMVEQYGRLLAGVAADPRRRVGDLPLLSEAESRQVLRDWNDTATDYPRAECLHELFERQAARTPEAAAVVYGAQSLTYAELNQRANRLARHLRALGVGPGAMVGLCVERSAEMVVALLAILKAGGAYVPLDPQYPAERLAFMIEDAAVPVLLTQQSLRASLPADESRAVLCLDTEWHLVAGLPAGNLPNLNAADELAYVIYTSGSTGKPKGVCVPHRAVSRLVFDTNYVSLRPDDRMAQVSNSSFDAATFEIWGALLHGAQLVGISKDVALAPLELAARIKEERVGVMFLTTALFNQIARAMPDAFASMRYVLFGGEAADPNSVREVALNGPPEHLMNVYGPTENTTFSTWFRVREVAEGVHTIPIGAPISNTRAYVLDRRQRPVPVGVAGELYLGGDGLARDYLNRPALTAERFVPDPFTDEPGARLYRTGDLVRFLADGQIEFVGRIDQQVKIRGFRIELGEIEAVLNEHESVSESVVVAREDAPGERRLVGYLTGAPGLKIGDVRAYLKERLPDYMVPSFFVLLDELPLTVNGKVDRRRLPEPSREAAAGERERARTAAEEMVANVFGQVLKVGAVGVGESFFELGGHSLLATQVMSRVREAFGVELPLRTLFEHPTVGELSRRIEQAIGEGQGTPAPPVTRASRSGSLPLSFAQQRLWFVDQLEPGSTSYNVPAAVRLTGALDVTALERTLAEIVRRHEVLRTTFSVMNGEPVQVINEARPVSLPAIDLSHMEEAEREAEAVRLAREEAALPFDLATGPLVRASLVRLSGKEHVCLLTMHHIVSDGWSVGVLIKEVAALYEAYAKGEESPLAELPVQYADYAVWQREHLRGEALDNQLTYWKQQLAGAPAALELPTDRPRPPVQTSNGARRKFELSPRVSGRLRELSSREGVTLYMTLLAAFQTLLARYSNQEDISVGTPVANRQRGETEGLIGFFVNTLVMRAQVKADESFTRLLGRVREACLGAYAHQDAPFERLVEELVEERDLSRTPLFQVWFVLHNRTEEELELPGLQLRALEGENSTAKHDLTLDVQDAGECLTGILEYNTDLFDGSTAERMVRHFEHLLEAIAADPVRRVGDLPLLSEGELRRMLYEWNDTAADYPREACLHELFEQQAARTPEAAAVVHEGERLSYGELDERANRLARHLRTLGVGPEVLVGICAERSLEMVVGLLGVLKAGGAYVPLDPTYPAERLDYMLKDASVSVVLLQQRFAASLPAHGARVVYLDADREALGCLDTGRVESGVTARNLAYVIYTSGSTGKPKGVLIPHASVVNHNFAVAERYELTSSDRVLQFASLNFDVAVEEIFPTWLRGGCVVLRSEQLLNSDATFFDFVEREGVTVVNLPTPYWNELIAARSRSKAQGPLGLRLVAIGGEKGLPENFAATLPHLAPGARLMNVYGPTETTVTNTAHEFRADERASASVPIGRPIGNTRLYVLDHGLRPVPVGVASELFIGGHSLARGYLARPALTAEKFVPDPYATEPGARMYRSGDLCRLLPTGEVEFVGRADHQVKIRGFRVELGEIESLLSEHAQVRQAIVVEVAGGGRLCAYVAVAGGEPASVAELRAYLKERLPDYMVPSFFVLLDELPLTVNGKVDRRRLPEPSESAETAGEYVAPRAGVEEVVCELVGRVLGLERVGTTDDFFELGGHSLLATQVMSRVREAFGVELPLRTLFEHPTVGELARKVEEATRGARATQAPPITRAPRDGALPLSFAQQRLWLLHQLEPGSTSYNVPAAVRLTGALDVTALERTLAEIVRRHEALRTTFSVMDGEPVQVIGESRPVSLTVADLRHLPEVEREAEAVRLAKEEAERLFDLERGPLVRASLVRLSEQEHVCLLTMHHIVSDGWSMSVLVKEVAALYGAYAKGEESPLAELPVQYADYAVWQREHLRGEVLENQLAYWRKRLGGRLPVVELPTDRLRRAERRWRGATYRSALPAGLAQSVRALSREHGATPYMTLLAAFQLLLARYTKLEDVPVGTAIANRQRGETEGLIGFFVNTLVMRGDLSGDPTFAELVGRARETALGAYAHQDVPFERIVEELRPDRSGGVTPLFQVAFGVQNAPEGELRVGGLEVGGAGAAAEAGRFDLTVWVEEEATGGLSCVWTYDTDLFDEARVRRMAAHFATLLEGCTAEPGRRAADIPLLTGEELKQQSDEEKGMMESNLKSLRTARRKSVNASAR